MNADGASQVYAGTRVVENHFGYPAKVLGLRIWFSIFKVMGN